MPHLNPNATRLGLAAIALWSLLAALTGRTGKLPPFQLTALSFGIATVVGLAYARLQRQPMRTIVSAPAGALALGVYGLLGFHVVYFLALSRAPLLEASLIVYLWPLLIVVFSALLPQSAGGGSLTLRHLAGAGLGFAGAVLLLSAAARPAVPVDQAVGGYLFALAAAVIWASYSVASRIYAAVPSVTLVAACAATALCSAVMHFIFETWTPPSDPGAWLAILALGLGPTGIAFYLWDEGMKHGNLRLLGVAAYATPLLSTLVLWAAGLATPNWTTWIAAAMIAAGALAASRP